MDLQALTRFLKTSVLVIQGVSIVNTILWITFFVLKGQNAESGDDCRNDTSNSNSSTTVNESILTTPTFCPDPPPFYTPENNFIFTYAILISLCHLGDQIFLYFAVHHRRIRRTQMFIIFSIAVGAINTILLLYLLICSKFWQVGLLSVTLVPRLTQIYFVIKFLHTLIASSPRASVVSTDSDVGLVQDGLQNIDINR
ncbi:unnamed protein product [Allacma fusca]|uniref:Uncharacterized protein n=1 Tax=Allacma fusca TaxID=39272 RepID=A0A8J2PY87_9HEXA|nr:unnamed protein product [Allacma fusca]